MTPEFPPDSDQPTANLRRSAPATQKSELPGWIGPYRILGELGRGGMGVVYLGQDDQLNRLTAIKTLLVPDPDAAVRFRLEAEAVARLQHPHIVQVHEISSHQGKPFMALEYLGGGTLSATLQQGAIPPRQAAALLRVLADAVHHAHQRGIIHRDLKPSNILLQKPVEQSSDLVERFPKIADFGIAKLLVGATSQTLPGQVIGTPHYMSPEQASGQVDEVGTASDVYSLGAILFEVLLGKPVFNGPNQAAILLQVRDGDIAWPEEARRSVPRDLEVICLKCLRKDPAGRYASAAALAEDLQRYLAGDVIMARPLGTGERVIKFARRRPALTTLVVCLAVLLGVGFSLALWSWRMAEQRADAQTLANEKAQTAQTEAQKRAEVEAQAKQAAQRAQFQAERREARLAYLRGQELCEQGEMRRGILWLARGLERASMTKDLEVERAARINLAMWKVQLGGMDRTLSHPDWVQSLAFSPDGKTLFVLCRDSKVRQWDAQTFKPLLGEFVHPSFFGFSHQLFALAVSPDGKYLATGGSQKVLRIWEVASRTVKHSQTLKGEIWHLGFSPDGKLLASGGDEGIRLWEVESGKEKADYLHDLPVGKKALCQAWQPDGKRLVFQDAETPGMQAASTEKSRSSPWQLKIHGNKASCAAFDKDGLRLVTGSMSGQIQIWKGQSGLPLGQPLWLDDQIESIAFSPDGSLIAACSRTGLARLWWADTGVPAGELIRLEASARRLEFHPSRTWLACGGHCRNIRCLGVPPHQQEMPAVNWRAPISGLHAQAGTLLLLDWHQTSLHIVGTGLFSPPLDYLQNDLRRCYAHAVRPDGKRIAFGLAHGVLGVRGTATPRCLWRDNFPDHHLSCLAFSPNAKALFVAAWNPKLTNSRSPIAWHYDADTGQQLRTLCHQADSEVKAALFLPDGQQTLLGFNNGRVQSWDLTTGQAVGPRMSHPSGVQVLALSPDGRRLAVGCQDGQVHLRDRVTGMALLEPLPHQGAVGSVAFTSDGLVLLTSSLDQTARRWCVNTGLPLGPPLPHRAPVATALIRDGNKPVSAGRDGQIRFWRPLLPPVTGDPTELRRELEQLVGLQLAEGK